MNYSVEGLEAYCQDFGSERGMGGGLWGWGGNEKVVDSKDRRPNELESGFQRRKMERQEAVASERQAQNWVISIYEVKGMTLRIGGWD